MKKYIYPLAITAAMLATTACSDDEVNAVDQPVPDSQKEMISFSLSDGAGTRAGFKGADTYVVMRIQSDKRNAATDDTDKVRYTLTEAMAQKEVSGKDYSVVSFNTGSTTDNSSANKRYWDDAYGRNGLLSVYAVAIPNGGSSLTGKNANLSTLLSAGNTSSPSAWGSIATNTITWEVSTDAQTIDATDATTPTSTINKEDLVYSNNIQSGGQNGVYRWDYSTGNYPSDNGGTAHSNGQMLFYQNGVALTAVPTEAPGHFDRGHLVFNHALSRMTITLVKGDGFDDFKFTDGTNIKLINMNTKGTLDIKTGDWTVLTNNGTITKMAPSVSTYTTAAGTYIAQMLPGYTFTDGSNTNVMEFTIDGNTYFVTQDMLFDALTYDKDGDGVYDSADGDGMLVGVASPITMEQGKNYSFTITVKKAAITNVTAALVDWNNITGSKEIDNTHITITTNLFDDGTGSLYEENHSLTSHYLLRHEELASLTTSEPTADTYNDYSGTYKDATTATQLSGTNKWSADNWYFNDNLTAYHIRTINDKAYGTSGSNVTTPTTGSDPESYFTMENGPQASTDYHWGAPMKTGATLVYNTTSGFSNSLYQGILSTKSDINITEFHMMSNIDVILTTPATPAASNNSVVLYDATANKGCTVEFESVLTTATVDMGTGLIKASTRAASATSLTSPTTYYSTSPIKTNAFTYAFVPQSLTNGTGTDIKDVSVKITTPDGNTYYVQSLKDVLVNGSTTEKKITEWLPNHHYVYTFNLTKTGIANITATLVDWTTVTAGNTDLDLEK